MEEEKTRIPPNKPPGRRTPDAEAQLASGSIGKLLLKYSIPSVSSSLIAAAYNIIDQVFIGQRIGYLGNAATNISFPISMLAGAVMYLIGMGGSSNMNLRLGAGKKDEAAQIVGTGIFMVIVLGLGIGAITFIFTEPLMRAFGATAEIFPYAVTYTRIIACGIPFLLFSSAMSNMIRSDGSPAYAFICSASGAVLHVILALLFIFILDMGIAGAAYSTIISQFTTFFIALAYMRRFKLIKLTRKLVRPNAECIRSICKLGIPGFVNSCMGMVVQITMNNTLRAYGATSIYGSNIPIAVVGVISKVNHIVSSFTIGTAQGCQPIVGYNYGAKNYARVKATYKRAAVAIICISIVFFACFQLFPRQIVSIFGSGDEVYYQFAERYMRIFMVMVFIIGMQPLTATFFTSIGKAYKGLFITVTRQGLFLLPCLLILPRFLGLDGIVFAGPIADCAALTAVFIMATREFRIMTKLESVGKLSE